jgi:hypothetical protein
MGKRGGGSNKRMKENIQLFSEKDDFKTLPLTLVEKIFTS